MAPWRRSRPRVFAVYGTISMVLFAVVVAARPDVVDHQLDAWCWLALLVPVTAITVLLLARLPDHGITRVLAVYVGCQLAAAGPMHVWRLVGGDGGAEFSRADNLLWLGTLPLLPLLITLFPDGTAAGRLPRAVARTQMCALAGLAGLTLIGVEPPPPPVQVLLAVLAATLVISAVIGVVLLVVRAFRDRSTRRDLVPFAVV